MMAGYKIPKISPPKSAQSVQFNSQNDSLSHLACQQKYNKLVAKHERTLGTWFAPDVVKALHQQIHRLTRCRDDLISENWAQRIIINDQSAVLIASFTEAELIKRIAGRDLAVQLNLIPLTHIPENHEVGPAKTPKTSKKHNPSKNRRRCERRRDEGAVILANAVKVLEAAIRIAKQFPEFVKPDEQLPKSEKLVESVPRICADKEDVVKISVDVLSAVVDETRNSSTSVTDDFGDELHPPIPSVVVTKCNPHRKRKFPVDIHGENRDLFVDLCALLDE